MRGITFTLEAVVTLIAITAIASSFVFTSNPPDSFIHYNLMASDIADLASQENFWANSRELQQQTVDIWSLKLGFCVKLQKEDYNVNSSNCGKASESLRISTDRVYFDKVTGRMGAFSVFISPPG